MELEELLKDLREYPGLARKSCIGDWARVFTERSRVLHPGLFFGPGDDAGAVETDAGYLLLAGEGIWPPLLEDPRFAGFCCVTVNANDVYAMGGRPLGMVAVVFSGGFTEPERRAFLDGLNAGIDHYGVPLLGGHTSPEGEGRFIAVSMMGFAKRLLRGDCARPGDEIMVALDLEGRRHPLFNAWDSVTMAEGDRTLGRLEALVEIGERGLIPACRDISNPGLLGTLAMMMEASGCGARVRIEEVPRPREVGLDWWLKAYPSYGFLFAAPEPDAGALGGILQSKGVSFARIGEVTEGSGITVEWKGETGLFLDWRDDPVTGLF